MSNTGFKKFLNIREFYVSNNQPTGRVKANPAPGQPDHVPPVQDLSMCPLPASISSFEKREYMFREIDGPGDADIYDDFYYPIIITTNSPDPTVKKWYYKISNTNAYESFPAQIFLPGVFTGTDDYNDIIVAINPPQAAFLNSDSLVAAYNVNDYTFTYQ